MSAHPITIARRVLVTLPLLPLLVPAIVVSAIGYGLHRGGEAVWGLCAFLVDRAHHLTGNMGAGQWSAGFLVHLEAIDLPVVVGVAYGKTPTLTGVALTLRWGRDDHDYSGTQAYCDGVPMARDRREVRQRGPVALFRTWTEGGEE